MTAPDPNAQGGDGTDPQSGQAGGEGGATGTGAQGGDSGQGSGTTGTGTETVSKAEFDALRARMQAADQRSSKAEGDLKQLRDKDLPEMERVKKALEEAAKERDTLQATNRELQISNAFLTDNTYKWRNPATALKLLDRSKLDFDSEGNVTGMKNALEALAKSDDYLLEPKPAAGDGEGQQSGPPGTAAGNGAPGNTGSGKKQLEGRFSALRGRGR
jgi:hypothetical protein